jgi:hemin uptake protein HemP
MRSILICVNTQDDQPVRNSGEPAALHRADSSLPRFSSAALLQGQRQIVIEHAGREYRLRLTAQGKLILTA